MNSANKEQPQNPSYKAQRLHAAVLLQSGSNILSSLVADLVEGLQNSCWPSRTPMKRQTRILHMKNNKSHKGQSLHSADLARFHARRKRNAISNRNSTVTRIDLLAIDVEFLAAQLHLRYGTGGCSCSALLHLRHGTSGCGSSVHAASGKNVAPNSTW